MPIDKNQEVINKYFIKDESLSNVDNDAFNHRDISKILCNIIDTTEPPYNIAVIGKWGSGKSSLINIALGNYKKNNNLFSVVEINAWKYEKEAITKVFLKQLWETIDGKKVKSFEKIKQRYSDIINAIKQSDIHEEKSFVNVKVFGYISGFLIFSVIMFAIYKIIQANVYNLPLTWKFWQKAFLSYCKNIVPILFLPILLIIVKLYLSVISNRNNNNVSFNIDTQSTDEYEMLLKDKIEEKIHKNKDYKIITVIDDLDRLSINKMVEALDAIKAFVGLERCIFIVPFDDAILKRALEMEKIDGLQSDNEIIESELILDKLFQFKIYLPPILKYDIKEYAIKLVKEKAPGFLNDYCNEEIMNNLIKRVLIHNGVTTPRQVKKIINIFISNYMIAFNRGILGKVERDIFTNDIAIKQIAKISVLQADFNEFYDLLFKNFNYLNLILECYQKKVSIEEIPEDFKCYFEVIGEGNNKKTRLKKEHIELLNYLSWTNKYKVDYIDQFMYLSQEKVSRKTGDGNFRKFIDAIESNNETLVSEMIEENKDNIEILNYKIEDSFESDLTYVLPIAINVFHLINEEMKSKIATNITGKIEDIKITDVNVNYMGLRTENIIDIYRIANNKKFGLTLLNNYIKAINKINIDQEEYIFNAINILIQNNSIFSEDTKKLIEELSKIVISNNEFQIKKIVNIAEKYVNNVIVYKRYFGIYLFDRIVTELKNNNLFEEYIYKAFINSFTLLNKDIDINELIKKILPLFIYPALFDLFIQILSKPTSNRISENNATAIAESIISINLDNDVMDSALEILNKISFTINANNGGKFDTFINPISQKAEYILKYAGDKGYLVFLPNTIKSIESNIFKNKDWDNIFEITECYFTKDQKLQLQNNLITNSRYNSYSAFTSRLISIYKILVQNGNNDELINSCIQDVISQFNSYYSQIGYFNFVSELMGITHESIKPGIIEQYLNRIISVFPSYVNISVQAIQRINRVINKDKWNIIMPLLLRYVSSSNYEMIFDIIEDNFNYFEENGNLTQHVNFLVNNINISNNPNSNIRSLGKHYKYISTMDDLIKKCVTNDNIDKNIAIEVVSKFIKNMDINNISSSVIEAAKSAETFNFISIILLNDDVHKLGDIIDASSKQLIITSPIVIIKNLLEFCSKNKSNIYVQSVLDICKIGFEHKDEQEMIDYICNQLSQFGKNFFAKNKVDAASVIYNCFNKTNSDNVKKCLLRIVSELKIKIQFKKLLSGQTETDYYTNHIRN